MPHPDTVLQRLIQDLESDDLDQDLLVGPMAHGMFQGVGGREEQRGGRGQKAPSESLPSGKPAPAPPAGADIKAHPSSAIPDRLRRNENEAEQLLLAAGAMDELDESETEAVRFWAPAAAWAKACGIAAEVYEDRVDFSVFNPRGEFRPDGYFAHHKTRAGFLTFRLLCRAYLHHDSVSEVEDIFGHPEVPTQGTVELLFRPSDAKESVDVSLILSWPFSEVSTDSDPLIWLNRGLQLGIRLRTRMEAHGLV